MRQIVCLLRSHGHQAEYKRIAYKNLCNQLNLLTIKNNQLKKTNDEKDKSNVKNLAKILTKPLREIAFSPYRRRTRFFALLRMTVTF